MIQTALAQAQPRVPPQALWSPRQLWGDARGGVALHVFEGKEP